MDKMEVDFNKYSDMHEEKEFTGIDKTVIVVRDHISYADKIQMVQGIVENCVMIHDDSCCYESVDIHAEQIKAMVKYYTNVDVDNASAHEVADFMINNGLLWSVKEYIGKDYEEAEAVFLTMLDMVFATYTDDMSLKKAIKTSFGFLFNGEDITESMAKAELTKDTMFKAIEALNQKEKDKQSQMKDGRLNIGGNVIDFAKRE